MFDRVKRRLFNALEMNHTGDKLGRLLAGALVSLIVISVLAAILETDKNVYKQFRRGFNLIELISVVAFTVEYVLRLWSSTSDKRFSGAIIGRARFVLTPLAMADLLAIAPFYLPVLIPLDLRFVRVLRLLRILRLLKLSRYSSALSLMGSVVSAKRIEIGVTLFLAFILLVFSSGIMYIVEQDAQPDTFPSMGSALWWGVVTLTTVGYGDVYPVTPLGKCCAAFVAVLSIGLFALPAGILASGFSEEIQRRRGHRRICPHCHRDVDASPVNSEAVEPHES